MSNKDCILVESARLEYDFSLIIPQIGYIVEQVVESDKYEDNYCQIKGLAVQLTGMYLRRQ